MLRAAVMGLGRVGLGYDYDRPVGTRDVVLTHAAAFAAHKRFELVGGIDPDPDARRRFEDKFGAPALADLAELPSEVDVIAVAVPTAAHRPAVEAALRASPRAVILEKPLAPTVAEGEAIVAACENAGCALLVNYMRRFDPALAELRADASNAQAGVGWYPGDLLEQGSHLVDLVAFLVGDITRAESLGGDDDLRPSVRLHAGGATIHLHPAPPPPPTLLQLELVGPFGALRYLQSGMALSTHGLMSSDAFAGVEMIAAGGDTRTTGLPRYGVHVLDALVQHLDGAAPLASTGETALDTLRLCQSVLA